MFKIKKIYFKYSLVALALLIAFFMALFPTSSFIGKPYIVDTLWKQQDYNRVGIYTVSPFEAAKFYSYHQSNCFWIDTRDAKLFSEDHLPIAINETIKQLQSTIWRPNDLILVYGDSTKDAQETVALLRQINNARAFAIEGGFKAVKKYLIDSLTVDIISEYDNKNLETLISVRNILSGKKTSSDQLLEQMKKNKNSNLREGC